MTVKEAKNILNGLDDNLRIVISNCVYDDVKDIVCNSFNGEEIVVITRCK